MDYQNQFLIHMICYHNYENPPQADIETSNKIPNLKFYINANYTIIQIHLRKNVILKLLVEPNH